MRRWFFGGMGKERVLARRRRRMCVRCTGCGWKGGLEQTSAQHEKAQLG